MRVRPRYIRIAKGLTASVVSLTIPKVTVLVVAIELAGQFRSIWIQEMEHEAEVSARDSGVGGVGGARGGRLGAQAPLMRLLVAFAARWWSNRNKESEKRR